MMRYPCKDCENRTVGCHSSCEKYKYVKAENEKLNNKINQMKKQESDFYEVMMSPRIKQRDIAICKNLKKYNYGK